MLIRAQITLDGSDSRLRVTWRCQNAMQSHLIAQRCLSILLPLLVLASIFAISNGQPTSSRINAYSAGATGDVAPLRAISGARTRLSRPIGVALRGNLYVSNLNFRAITVYELGATGNVPPVRTIRGARTGLSFPYGVVLDATGNLYVSNNGNDSITVYAPGAAGNVAPLRTIWGTLNENLIQTELSFPYGVALDAAGNLYVSNLGDDSITVYAAGRPR